MEPEPKQFVWLQPKTFRWCNQSRMAGAWNLDSGSTALVWGASQLCKQYNGFQISMNQGLPRVKGKGSAMMSRSSNHWRGVEMCQQCRKYFHLLPKVLRFRIWGAKLVSCPGRHVTSVGLAMGQINLFCKIFVRWFFIANFPENSLKCWKIREISTTGKQTDQKLERRPKR